MDFFVCGAYEERYFSLLTPVVALLAFGSEFILRLSRPQVRRGVQWGLVVILLSFFIFNRPIADARSDQTAKVFTEALEQDFLKTRFGFRARIWRPFMEFEPHQGRGDSQFIRGQGG